MSSRSKSNLKKQRGLLVTEINGHVLEDAIRWPSGGEDFGNVLSYLENLREKHPKVRWVLHFPKHVKIAAQYMGIKQEDLPCCYGPQMPHSIYKSAKAT